MDRCNNIKFSLHGNSREGKGSDLLRFVCEILIALLHAVDNFVNIVRNPQKYCEKYTHPHYLCVQV